MKVYSDILSYSDLVAALPRGVTIAVAEPMPRPRKRRNGWTISLSGSSPYRSQMSDGGHRSATWDEHGVWMDRLFAIDPDASIATYRNREHFMEYTSRYIPEGMTAPWLERVA